MSRIKQRNVVSLDLEHNQPSGTIIEIGLAVGNLDTKEILGTHSVFVDPHEILSPEIIKLTTIRQSDVDRALDLIPAYNQAVEWMRQWDPHPQVVTWGGGDHYELKRQLVCEGHPDDWAWEFGRTYMNVKTVYQALMEARGQSTQGGLAGSMKRFGMNFQGTKHRADSDAKETLRIYFKLLDILGGTRW